MLILVSCRASLRDTIKTQAKGNFFPEKIKKFEVPENRDFIVGLPPKPA